MTAAVITCIGKLPIHGDFVRCNQHLAPEVVEFDAWLLDGMERAYGARGRAFETELRALAPLRFLFTSPKTGRLLDGIVLPSADQVGRVYPFVAGFVMQAPTPGPAYDRLPLMGQAQVQAIRELFGNAAGNTLPHFLERLQALAFPADDNAAEQALRSFLFSTTLDALWADWPGFHPVERRQQCLQELWQMAQPPFPPRYLTLMPMREVPGEVAFWLSMLRQWLPIRRNPTLLCWPAAGATGPIRILFDELHSRYFEPIFWPARSSTHVLDLGRQQGQHRSAIGGPVGGMASLLKPRTLLSDVILSAARA